MNFKSIHIGILINKAVTESGIEMSRFCNFFKCSTDDISEMMNAKSIDTETLLKWCKLLEYDFFRIYTQHLILYAPTSAETKTVKKANKKITFPQFRKNIYTKEIIDFILEQIETKQKTIKQVIEEYKIPKTTLYKWISKYKINPNED